MERSQELSMDQAFLQSFKEIVLSNLQNEQFGAEDLSSEIGLSRSQVHRKLQKINGKSITQFIRETRLDVAHDLLSREVGTAAEISYRVGFSSPAYFTKCFHDYFGYPPSEAKYRSSVSRITSNDSTPKLSKVNRRFLLASTGILLIVVTIILGRHLIPEALNLTTASENEKEIDPSIAILPIKYLSQEEDKQYFADGVINAITSNLAKIEELNIIAGPSVQRYREQKKDVRDIGKELNVRYIVGSSFQLEGNQARLFIQIYSAKEGSLVWSNEYDREWTDVFEVQSEVSQQIAQEIAISINPENKSIFDEAPTNDLTAYDFYLRGEEYLNRSFREEDYRYAMQFYKKAIGRDSTFVLAWVGLSNSSRLLYHFYYDRNELRIQETREYLNHAIKLKPNLFEVEMERAKYMMHIERRYEDALKIFKKLNSKYPRNAEIYSWLAILFTRIGEFEKAVEYYNYTLNLDPSNWQYLNDAGWIYLTYQKNFRKAEESFRKIVELYPSLETGFWCLYALYYHRGDIVKLNDLLHDDDIPIDSVTLQIEAALLEGNYETAILKKLKTADCILSTINDYFSNNYKIGLYYYLNSENEKAKEYFNKEKLFLEEKLASAKDDFRIYGSLGIVYAGLGEKTKAIEAGQRAIEICDISRDTYWCPGYSSMAKIYLMLGEYDKGIAILESILNAPVGPTVELLKNRYDWRIFMKNEKYRAMVNDPRYQIENIEISN